MEKLCPVENEKHALHPGFGFKTGEITKPATEKYREICRKTIQSP
ncbi:MAG: hypothetical protein ACOCYF_02480 [Bacteroidota bacterium]